MSSSTAHHLGCFYSLQAKNCQNISHCHKKLQDENSGEGEMGREGIYWERERCSDPGNHLTQTEHEHLFTYIAPIFSQNVSEYMQPLRYQMKV